MPDDHWPEMPQVTALDEQFGTHTSRSATVPFPAQTLVVCGNCCLSGWCGNAWRAVMLCNVLQRVPEGFNNVA